jgi:Chaperone of endosialidase
MNQIIQHSIKLIPYDAVDLDRISYSAGDVVFDYTNQTLRIMDGIHPGGESVATHTWVKNSLSELDAPISFTDTTESTSTSTGAVVISGGVGIAKNVNIGGNVNIAGTITITSDLTVNTDKLILNHTTGNLSIAGNLAVNGGSLSTTATTANLFNTPTTINFGNSATSINVGTSIGTFTINNAALIHNSSSYFKFPVGNSLARPGSPSVGMVRYNTDITSFEGYVAGSWSSLGGVKSVDGKTYILAESYPGAGDDVLHFYSGASGSSSQVGTWNNTSLSILNNTGSTDTNTGSLVVTGGVGISENVYIGGNLSVNNGILSTTASVFNLLNTGATTVFFGGSATSLNIGASTGTTTVNNNLAVTGNLTVNGTTTTINSTTLAVDDKNIVLGNVASPSDATAGGGGFTLLGTTNKTFAWTSPNWVSSEGIQIQNSAGLSTNQTTFPLINTTATTINFGGAATTLNIGATSGSGTTYVKNNFKVTGTVDFTTNVLGITSGGTGANTATNALTNLIPTGEVSGYVLTTSGRGSYYWAAASGGGGSVGTAINTTRTNYVATASQTLFTGVGTYVPGAGQLRVYIDGVRQFPAAYTETSTTSFTLTTGVSAGANVLAEVDGYVSYPILASNVSNSPAGGITSTDVQSALNQLDSLKAPKASPTFTGHVTVEGVTSTGATGSGNFVFDSSPQIVSLGVGTAASGTTGEIRASNNITAYYSSDARLKENIQPIPDALVKLNQIRGVTFDWTDQVIIERGGEDGYFVRKNDIGVIAQEIEAVLPEIVATRSDGFKAVRYELLVALLIQAVKELQQEVDDLKYNRI